jgi:hypothetical protein
MASDTVKIISSLTGPRCILPSGEQLQGVTRIAWSAEVGDIARAEVTMFSDVVEVDGALQVMMLHPITGTIVTITSIAFADGTTWPA